MSPGAAVHKRPTRWSVVLAGVAALGLWCGACRRDDSPQPSLPSRQQSQDELPDDGTPTVAFPVAVTAESGGTGDTPGSAPVVGDESAFPEVPDFSDGGLHVGDYLLWVRDDELYVEETVWLAVSATGTQELGTRNGLWVATGADVWRWESTEREMPVCGIGGCLAEVPTCRKARKTGQGLGDRVRWVALLGGSTVDVGPRLAESTPVGLGALSFAERWTPLAVVDGLLLVRVDRDWQDCDGDGRHGLSQVHVIAPPAPALRPLISANRMPAELIALPGGDHAVWSGFCQSILPTGRWRTDDHWALPLPGEETATSALRRTSQATTARQLPGEFARRARQTPRIWDPKTGWQSTGQGTGPHVGWSKLVADPTHRSKVLDAWSRL